MSDTAPETAPAAAPQMPLFFSNVVGVNPSETPDLRLDRTTGYRFAAAAQWVPIGLAEFEAAGRCYPILFTAGPDPVPVVLVGLDARGNLFIDKNGAWRPDTYVPAYVRSYPFVLIDDQSSGATYVGMETTAEAFSNPDAARMFEDGKPTQMLNDAVALCTSSRANINAATAMARALATEGLLEEEEAAVTFTGGGELRVRGFQLLRADRLAAVSDATFLEWRQRGWLGAIYAHLHSAGSWARLIELASVDLPATPTERS